MGKSFKCEAEDNDNDDLPNNEIQYIGMSELIQGDCTIEFLTFENDKGKETLWHSSAHILGSVIEHLY